MKIIHTAAEWYEAEKSFGRNKNNTAVGLVLTMGALHEGHRSLVERSVRANGVTVVSIFVNPVQFNSNDDLASYPRTFEEDCRLLETAGADYVFAPGYAELYPDDYRYRLTETVLSKTLCGASRPGHFDGVLTVVMKLLQMFRPERAYFGEKDYQQYELVAGMASAFFLRTRIIACPTVRERSGLACSSRNRRLSSEGLARAPLFHRELASGHTVSEIRKQLEKDGFRVDYVTESDGRLYGAVYLEDVRLIDNVEY
ncbi:MAG TPA: pantoate--beta-alanine ligase [Treponema sp.]|nr:pantoate--beta-alanine ligase [Treponema sp.]